MVEAIRSISQRGGVKSGDGDGGGVEDGGCNSDGSLDVSRSSNSLHNGGGDIDPVDVSVGGGNRCDSLDDGGSYHRGGVHNGSGM